MPVEYNAMIIPLRTRVQKDRAKLEEEFLYLLRTNSLVATHWSGMRDGYYKESQDMLMATVTSLAAHNAKLLESATLVGLMRPVSIYEQETK